MRFLLLLGSVAFLACAIITPVLRRVLVRCGVIDVPDARRKLHGRAVARGGGIAIAISYAVTAALIFAWLDRSAALDRLLAVTAAVALPAALVFGIGLLDDVVGLRPWQKLSVQVLAAVWAYSGGVRVGLITDHVIPHWLGFLLTIGWLLLCTNAFNLLDGIDGLAAGAALVAATTMTIAAISQGNYALAVAAAPLIGSLAAFLIYNSSPASIFLGDSGSLTLGFVLGCFAIVWSQKSATLLSMTAPLIALALPLADTLLAVTRRFLRLRPIFTADRGHIHHTLLDRGLTPRRVTFLLYGVSGVAAALSLMASVLHDSLSGLFLLLCCLTLWWFIHKLHVVELRAARKLLFGRFRGIIEGELIVLGFEKCICGGSNLDECWNAIANASAELDFAQIELHAGDKVYERTLKPIDASVCWSFHLPLSDSAYIAFRRAASADFEFSVVGPFFELVRRSLQANLAGAAQRTRQPLEQLISVEAL